MKLSSYAERSLASARYFALIIGGVVLIVNSYGFTPNDTEERLASLITTHSNQRRSSMDYDFLLSVAARAKAEDMAKRRYASHTDPDGYGPNKAVQLAGYRLPGWWPNELDSNFVESLAFGHRSAEQAFGSLLGSSAHRRHILAEDAFFKGHTRYGIGYAEVAGSPYGRYYVILTAPPGEAFNGILEPYVEWLFSEHSLKEIATIDDDADHDGDGLSQIMEFALGLDPDVENQLPMPQYRPDGDLIEWPIPLRSDLGSIQVEVQFSTNMESWRLISNVRRASDRFVMKRAGRQGFLRLMVAR